MEDYYAQYDEWKGWGADQFMVLDGSTKAYYDAEFADISVRGEKVLEIGFGSGTLLEWLRQQDAKLYGTELSPLGRSLALQNGVTVLDTSLSDLTALEGHFGVIAAFDVLEHLTYEEIRNLFDKAAVLLRPGGHFVARFPNGASPFGRIHQHDDITHVSTLTAGKIAQLIMGKPFAIERAGATAMPRHGSTPARAAKAVRAILRWGFERGVSSLYGYRVPFSFNLIVMLRRVDGNATAP